MDGNIMKKVVSSKNIYDKCITIDNIYKIWNIIKRTCKNRKEIYYFSLNLGTNIMNIYYTLKEKRYIPSKYRVFMIFEPKPRLVMSQSVKDKIINHFITNYYLIPYLDNLLIDSNVATRKNKGSSYAMILLKKYFNKIIINNKNKEIYCLKVDINKYFYNIDHNILINMLEKRILDKDVINLIKIIIRETNKDYINNIIKKYIDKYQVDIPYYINNKGLSIGAMTSQFLAIFYLYNLEILDTSKDRIKNSFKEISSEIEKLNLKVNKKSNIYRTSKWFNFLGFNYRLVNNKIIVSGSKDTVIRINKKLNILQKKDKIAYLKSEASYYGYFKIYNKIKRNSFKMKSSELYELYKEKYPDRLVIIKEGIFYKSYYEDGKIIWYLFDYKYLNNYSSFGNNSYDKVISKFKELELGYIIIDKNKELVNIEKEMDIYKSYVMLANKKYGKYDKKKILIDKINTILDNDFSKYETIDNY